MQRAFLIAVVGSLLLTGALFRLAPLASEQRTVAAISEDGYLMLTVARNVASGRSLTIADGTIATNGVQPLVTFVWAALHWLQGSERLPSLRAVIVMQFVVAAVTAVLIAGLIRHAFQRHQHRDPISLLGAALWFASPLAMRHTTNGLETGFYALAIAAILLIDLRWRGESAARAVGVGALLGLLFLVRNDAIFFIAAFLLMGLRGQGRNRLRQTAIMAATSLVVASPWLIYNLRVFGNLIPISGRAQNLNLATGENLVAVPKAVAEFAWMATPLPAKLGLEPFWALATAFAVIGVVAATLRRSRAVGLSLQPWMTIVLLHSALLCAYYGVFFGASYFLTRYLFPLSLVAVLIPCVWIIPGARDTRSLGTRGLLIAAALALLVMGAASRAYLRAAEHDHGAVVQWVADHVPAEVWVGAPQSGMLGYFHDRTVNLDGKVNPLALQARRDNRLFHYIVEDTPVEYIADWYGLSRWVDRLDTVRDERDVDLLQRKFFVAVREPERNLFVLRRVSSF